MKISDFLAKLGKPNGKPENAEKLSVAIGELERERGKAQAALATASQRRTEMLLADDDAALDLLDREIEAAHRMIERVDLALPALRERLLIAKDKFRISRIAALREENAAAFAHLDAAVQQAMAANKRANEIHEQARRELGEGAARNFVPCVAYLAPVNDVGYEQWKKFNVDAIDPQRPEPPRARPALVEAKPVPRAASPASRPTKTARPATIREIPKPGADGKISVVVLQHGFPDAAGKPLKAGAEVRLPLSDAKSALENGTVDLTELRS